MSDQAKISLSGEIINIKDTVTIGTFDKRELWLKETTSEYPQTYCIEFVQDKCSILDRYKIGDEVEIGVNLRGRYWSRDSREGVMNSLQGWRISLKSASGTAAPHTERPAQTPVPAGTEDDLPF